jgi:hypothetical protein
MAGSGQPATGDGGATWQRPATLAPGLGLASDGPFPGYLATRGVQTPTPLLLGWPVLASGTGEWLDLGGGEKARWLGGGGRGEQAARCGRGECRETEWGNVAMSSFFLKKAVKASN